MIRPWVGGWVLLRGCCLALSSCSSCTRKDAKGPTGGSGEITAAGPVGDQPQIKDTEGLLGPALQGWMGRLAQEPTEFVDLTRSSEGWNFFWEAELGRAAEAFAASQAAAPAGQDLALRLGLGRALLELGVYHRQLYQATLEFLRQYLGERDQRRDKVGPISPAEQFYTAQVRLLRDGKEGAVDATAMLKQLSSNPAAGVFALLARPWLGLALFLGGDTAGAERSWKEALAEGKSDPNLALLVAYTQARAGRWTGETLPESDGSGYGRRLRFAALVRTGKLDQALHELSTLRFRKPDHVVSPHDAKAPVLTPEDKGDVAGGGDEAVAEAKAGDGAGTLDEEKTNLDFYAPYVLEELARLRFLQASRALEGAGLPGGCATYWRARAFEALDDREAALAAYQAVQGGPLATAAPGGKGAAPANETIACLVLDVHGTVQELVEEAGLRVALLQEKPLAGLPVTNWANKLALVEGRANADATAPDLLSSMAFLPEDMRSLESVIEEAFGKKYPEKGVNAVVRGRFIEHYVHNLYLVQARVAARMGERRLTVKVLEALHDNTQQDEVTTLNRPAFLLQSAMARWQANDPQGTGVLFNVLWKRYPEAWPASEYVRRIRAFQALDNIKSSTPIR